MPKPPRKKRFISVGTVERVEEGWCNFHQASTIWTGPAYELTARGVTLIGKIWGCARCEDWTWYNLDGTVLYKNERVEKE